MSKSKLQLVRTLVSIVVLPRGGQISLKSCKVTLFDEKKLSMKMTYSTHFRWNNNKNKVKDAQNLGDRINPAGGFSSDLQVSQAQN